MAKDSRADFFSQAVLSDQESRRNIEQANRAFIGDTLNGTASEQADEASGMPSEAAGDAGDAESVIPPRNHLGREVQLKHLVPVVPTRALTADDPEDKVDHEVLRMAEERAAYTAAVSGPKSEVTVSKPAEVKIRYEKFQGRRQMNFGVDRDVFDALKYHRCMERDDNSAIINKALWLYLAPEIRLLVSKGRLDDGVLQYLDGLTATGRGHEDRPDADFIVEGAFEGEGGIEVGVVSEDWHLDDDRVKKGRHRPRLGRFKGRAQMNFGVDEEVFRALNLRRAAPGITNSSVINMALRRYLAEEFEELRDLGRL